MLGRRVAVTGIGVVAKAGLGKDEFWKGLIGDAPEGSRFIEDWDASSYFDNPKDARRSDRYTQFALAAATEAIAQAGDITTDPARRGTSIGTGIGGIGSLETQIEVRLQKGEKRVSPFLVPMMMPNAAPAAVSMRFGWQGPCENTVTACFANMTALSSSDVSMPFDAKRDGFVMGEGCGLLVLEAWDVAIERGATILGEILGSASTADAHHITAPAPGGTGAVSCMQLAIEDAGLTAADIGHVNAHGTSTSKNDAAEAEAVAKVFGTDGGPLITSTKGITGHALGAAGALEAVAVLLSMHHKLIPPTAGLTEPDPDLPTINLVMGEPKAWTPAPSLSNSFGFGGHNATLGLGPA